MTDDGGNETDSAEDSPEQVDLLEAQSLGREYAESVLSDPVDNVIRVDDNGEDWRVIVEVVERSAVPDTQDILARYELTIGPDGDLVGYGLVDRYRRGDLRGDL